MTLYNQRVNALVSEDRILCKHAKEVSALIIRTIMPAIDSLKLIDKSLTAIKKNNKATTLAQLSKQLVKPVQSIELAFNTVQKRLDELTQPLELPKRLRKLRWSSDLSLNREH